MADKTYTADDLNALGESQADFKGVTYVGVSLTVLLKDAGIDPTAITIVKAVACDGFTANYKSALFAAKIRWLPMLVPTVPLAKMKVLFEWCCPIRKAR